MQSMTFNQRVLDIKSFFLAFSIATIIYAILAYFWVFFPEIFTNLEMPMRIDFIMYLLCIIPVSIAGFFHGYRKNIQRLDQTIKQRLDRGFYYLQLYSLVGLIYGPCIWDNIVIIYRVVGPEHLNLAAQMEIQFIFVFFLSISGYRFFTIIYVIVGSYFLIYIRKRSQIVWVYLFFIYIYSSLVIGIIFGLDLYPTSFLSEAIQIYVLYALIIFGIVSGIYLIIKHKKDKLFE